MTETANRTRRNFALIGHAHDGKTSIGESLLLEAGAIAARDDEPPQPTHATSVFTFPYQDHSLTLVDTPGDPNFQAAGRIALHALDGAILVLSAVDGAKVGSERMASTARDLGIPLLAFATAMDRERANWEDTVKSLSERDMAPAPVSMPLGSGNDFFGVVDLLTMSASTAEGDDSIPNAFADEARAARQRLVEAVAECDDALLEQYLEEGDLSNDDLQSGLVAGTRRGALIPVFAGAAPFSSPSRLGCPALLQGILDLLPSPIDARRFEGTLLKDGSESEIPPNIDGPFSGLVFKTAIDRYAGTLSVIRVVSGRLVHDTPILNATRGTKERIGKLMVLRGTEHVECESAGPGDIVAVAKLKGVHTGDALTAEKGGLQLPAIPIPHGVLSYAIAAVEKGEEDKVFSSLARLAEEDPTLQIERDPRTGQFLMSGMGELHIRSAAANLKHLYNLEIELKRPKVPYRETVTRKAEHVEGKLKKQSGGKGMYGVCYLDLEPMPRGGGVEFVDKIVGGAIPRNLIPAVEKGALEACERGPLAGFPVVDVRITCRDGKHHSVDSNEMAFKLAGSMGFRAAMEQAKATLLEPLMSVDVAVPDDHMGDVIGDLNGRRGRVQSTDSKAATSVIKAQVPMAEMLEYASVLTSLTGGKGSFHMEFSHYDELPAQFRDKVIEASRTADGEL